MPCAPIALFVYNRPTHTRKTVEALLRNTQAAESQLFIFSDGPKNAKAEEGVRMVRDYIQTIQGFKQVTLKLQSENRGLANSIIAGVTELLQVHDMVIVLEDDLVTGRYFLQFMNDALEYYKQEERVVSVHGYVYPVRGALPETFFLKGADCWGWATWKRGWDTFRADGKELLAELESKKLTQAFDFGGVYPYTRMLKQQILGMNNSWAIRWYASAFLADKLTLYPGHSLVANIGFDNTGTHTGTSTYFTGSVHQEPIQVQPIAIEQSAEALKLFRAYFSSWNMRVIKLSMRLDFLRRRIISRI